MVVVEITKPAMDWFAMLGLGVVGGIIGQGMRAVIGLKKVHDTASAPGETKSADDMMEPSRLFVSLLIGAIAGALAAITTIDDLTKISLTTFFGLAAAGYAGTDFIEGFMSRIVPKPDAGTSGGASSASAADDAVA